MHTVIAYSVSASINEVSGAFIRAAYVVGGHRFSLDDIEHGILRANAGHPFDLAAANFTRSEVQLDRDKMSLALSRLFSWIDCTYHSCRMIGR